MHYQS